VDDLDIFSAALELGTPEEREKYVDEACVDNPALRERVEALLRSSAKVSHFMEAPLPRIEGSPTLDVPPTTEQPGQTIGHYKLLEEIGEGGMGVVYMAEQQEPVHRQVALKILKPGMDTRQVIARFEAERQALALMDHPSIAHVFDAGTAESGRPYFVMEFVDGSRLTECCDQKQLATRQRLELFVQVCLAVQHAHQKGIIHRDLKPSNVLVTLYDDVPVPKIIDFGIAKAVHRQPGELAVTTSHGLMMGTPLYMSPEQAGTSGLDVDTRSDIYSLGVILYELLTGHTPFDDERVREAGYDEIRRMIREEEPPRPSARISTLGEAAAATVSMCRKTEPARLSRMVRGDLDWIVMKALEKDPARRYQTANDLAQDIQRHLADEPIDARPPSLFDHAAKWTHRHRPLVWSAAALLVLSTIGSTVSALLIGRERSELAQAYKDKGEQLEATQRAEGLAKQQEGLAKEQQRLAKQQQKLAVAQREEATRQRDAAEENLYLAHIHLAWQDWHAGQVSRIYEMLQKYLPQSGRRDFRGWEWYFLLSLCHRERILLRDPAEVGFACMAWNAKRNWLAGGSRSGQIHVWDPTSGKQLFTLQGSLSGVYGVAWSPDGNFFAAGSAEDVRVWDIRSRAEICRWCASPTSLNQQLSWSPDGKYLAYEDLDDCVTIRSLIDGKLLRTRLGEGVSVASIAWSADGKYMAIGSKNVNERFAVRISDPMTGREIRSWEPVEYDVLTLAWSPDGKRLATGTYGQRLQVWETGSWRELLRIPHSSGIEAVAWSPDGRYLGSCTRGAEAIVWDSQSGKQVNALRGHTDWIRHIAWGPDGQCLATQASDGIRVWDPKKSTENASLDHSGVEGFAWCRDGSRLATIGGGKVRIWNSSRRREIASWDRRADYFVWHPDGKRLALMRLAEKTVEVVDAHTGRVELTFPCFGGPRPSNGPLDWSRDGTRLAFADDLLSVSIADVSTGRILTSLHGHSGPVGTVRFRPDGRLLASTAWDGTVRVWDPAAGKCLVTYQGHAPGRWISGLAWSPDGKQIASGGWDQRIEVWDAETGKGVASLSGHTSPVWGLDWSAAGMRLASASSDGTVKLWNTNIWEEVLSIDIGSTGGLARWSPDSKQLATARKAGNTVELWDSAAAYEFAESAAYRLERAQLLALRGRPDEARALLQRWIAEYPRDSAYCAALAAVHFDEGARLLHRDPQRAVAAFTEALRLKPGEGSYLLRRAIAYSNLREFEKAAADYRAVIRLDPQACVARNALAMLYLAAGRLDHYRATCAACVEHFGRTEDPETAASVVLTCAAGPDAVGDWSKVIGLAEMARRSDAKSPFYECVLGMILYRAGRFGEAIEHLTEANPNVVMSIDTAGMLVEHRYFLGLAQYRVAHAKEAKKWLDEVDHDSVASSIFAWEFPDLGARVWFHRALIESLRAEAARVIGISEKQSSTKEKPK